MRVNPHNDRDGNPDYKPTFIVYIQMHLCVGMKQIYEKFNDLLVESEVADPVRLQNETKIGQFFFEFLLALFLGVFRG